MSWLTYLDRIVQLWKVLAQLYSSDFMTGEVMSQNAAPSMYSEKQRILNRLRRLEGQVRGLHRMVEEERPCEEILTLLASIKSALNATGDVVFEQYLDRCQQQGQPLQPGEMVKVVRLLR